MKVPPFTLVQLHYFAAAVECGSMTAASRELMVSQSAVSTAIAQLEKALGVTLVLRHHAHGLALTGAGRAFHAELRAFLAHSQELADTAANAGQALVGDLTVGCFATLAPFRLPRILASLREAHPAVSVHVLEAEHAELKRRCGPANARLPSRTATTSKRTWFPRTSARPRPMSCSPSITGSPGVRLSRCATWRTTR